MTEKKLNVLLYGIGSVFQAYAEKIYQSPLLNKLYTFAKLLPPQQDIGEPIKFADIDGQLKQIKDLKIDLIITNFFSYDRGLTDIFKQSGAKIIGVTKKFSLLEYSKKAGKLFADLYNIPHPKYFVINKKEDIYTAIKNIGLPIVLKSDSMRVKISLTQEDAINTIEKFVKNKASEEPINIIAEEYIEGEELSCQVLWNGKNFYPLSPVRDYKKDFYNNTEINTPGMGSYCPVKVSGKVQKNLDKFLKTTETAFQKAKADFCGFVFFGLKITKEEEIKLLEFNMRLGDSEGQTVLNLIDTDILDVLWQAACGNPPPEIKYKKGISGCVNIISDENVRNSEKCAYILKKDIDNLPKDIKRYLYSIVNIDEEYYFVNSFRLASFVNVSEKPFEKIYNSLKNIKLINCHYRTDIGNEIDD